MTDDPLADEDARSAAVWRWVGVFELLGLDCAAPLYPELGLDPAHAAAWRTVARHFLETYYGWIDATIGIPGSCPRLKAGCARR